MPDSPMLVVTIIYFFIESFQEEFSQFLLENIQESFLVHSVRGGSFLNFCFLTQTSEIAKEGKDELAVGKEYFSKTDDDLIAYFAHI